MKRIIFYIFLLITSFVLQGTLFKTLSFGGISPNLLLVCVVSFGLMRGEKTGLLLGFFSGLLMDVFLGPFIGFYALLLMYVGFVTGFFHKVFFAEDLKLPLLLIIVSDISYGFLCYVLLFLLRGKTDILYYFMHVIIPECVYTTVVTILIYPLCLFINHKLETDERKRAIKFV